MTAPVIFLPGSLSDERLFAHQRAALGVDNHVAGLTGSSSIEELAAHVLAAAPLRFSLVGLSFGGIVAAEIARIAGARLTGLALLDTNLGPMDSAQVARRRGWARDARAGHFPRIVEELVPVMTSDPSRHGALVAEMAMAAGPSVFLRQNEAVMNRRDNRDVVSDLSCPILVACGADDLLCPPALHRDLAGRAADVDLHVIEGAGHLSTIDQPEALTEVLRGWLEMCNNNPPRRGTQHEYSDA